MMTCVLPGYAVPACAWSTAMPRKSSFVNSHGPAFENKVARKAPATSPIDALGMSLIEIMLNALAAELTRDIKELLSSFRMHESLSSSQKKMWKPSLNLLT